jgi:REP-associated tyrosine transposase
MGRPLRPRPDPDGATTFRALNRGNNGAEVFFDDGDRLAFLDALAKAKARYPFRLYSYCLMTNHVHLAVRPGQSISRIMQSITVAHTWRHHRRHRSSGHVWQGRFKSPAIQDGDQLLTLLCYIEANPLRAGIVEPPSHYPWSSHAARVTGARDPLLDDFPEWAELGGDETSRRSAWRLRVARPLGDVELSLVRQSSSTGRPLGTEAWAVATSVRLGFPPPAPKRRGRPPKAGKMH